MTPQVWDVVGFLLLVALILSFVSYGRHQYGKGPGER